MFDRNLFDIRLRRVNESNGVAEIVFFEPSDDKRRSLEIGFPSTCDLFADADQAVDEAVLSGDVAEVFYSLVKCPVDVDAVQFAVHAAAMQALKRKAQFESAVEGAKLIAKEFGAEIDAAEAERCAKIFLTLYDGDETGMRKQMQAVVRDELKRFGLMPKDDEKEAQ